MARRTALPEGNRKKTVSTGVYLKSNGRFLAQYRDPGRKQHWKQFSSKAEAERWRARCLLDPTALLQGKRTLQEVWETLLVHQAPNMHVSTVENWTQEWRKHIQPGLGNWPIGKITTIAIKDFLAGLEQQGVGAATRTKCRSILHRVLEEAVENGELQANPVSPGTRVKQGQRRKARTLSPREVFDTVDAARRISSDSDALAIEVMFMLGLRIGEMAGLQARDLDVSRHELTIQRTVTDLGGHLRVQEATKTDKYRVLPLPPDLPAVRRLVDHVKQNALIGQAHLFQSKLGGPVRPGNWRTRVWARALEEAGVADPPSPHSARRTTASLLSDAGVPPATIQAVLGHSTLQQTGEYIAVPQTAMTDAFQRLSRVYDARS
jgi:integrase